MISPDLLKSIREQRHIDLSVLAKFVSITLESYYDLEDGYDTYHDLTVIQLIRLCVILDINPSAIIENDIADNSINMSLEIINGNSEDISHLLSRLLNIKGFDEDKLGWDQNAIINWLDNNNSFGDIPIEALVNVCNYIGISYIEVLDSYFHLVDIKQ